MKKNNIVIFFVTLLFLTAFFVRIDSVKNIAKADACDDAYSTCIQNHTYTGDNEGTPGGPPESTGTNTTLCGYAKTQCETDAGGTTSSSADYASYSDCAQSISNGGGSDMSTCCNLPGAPANCGTTSAATCQTGSDWPTYITKITTINQCNNYCVCNEPSSVSSCEANCSGIIQDNYNNSKAAGTSTTVSCESAGGSCHDLTVGSTCESEYQLTVTSNLSCAYPETCCLPNNSSANALAATPAATATPKSSADCVARYGSQSWYDGTQCQDITDPRIACVNGGGTWDDSVSACKTTTSPASDTADFNQCINNGGSDAQCASYLPASATASYNQCLNQGGSSSSCESYLAPTNSSTGDTSGAATMHYTSPTAVSVDGINVPADSYTSNGYVYAPDGSRISGLTAANFLSALGVNPNGTGASNGFPGTGGAAAGGCPDANYTRLGGSGICVPVSTGLSSATLSQILTSFLDWILGIFTTLAILAFVISGVQYLTSAGDEGMIETAKRNAKWSIIGIVIGLSGFVVLQAVASLISGTNQFF